MFCREWYKVIFFCFLLLTVRFNLVYKFYYFFFKNKGTYTYIWAGCLSRYSDWLRAGRSGIETRWRRDFPPVETDTGAHPASCKMGTGSFPGVETAGAWGWPSHPHLVWKVLETILSYNSTHPKGAYVAYKRGDNIIMWTQRNHVRVKSCYCVSRWKCDNLSSKKYGRRFRLVRKIANSDYQLSQVCQSVRPHGKKTLLPLNGFP